MQVELYWLCNLREAGIYRQTSTVESNGPDETFRIRRMA